MTETAQKETFQFQAEVHQVLSLVINSLYSNKEIFLRELISNAADALDKLSFRSLTEHELMGDDKQLEIRLVPDADAGTLTIEDNGIGMSREELIENLGTVAHSGSRAFLEQLASASEADRPKLIGQFGVGFYSSYLVADRVDVVSRAAGQDDAMRWSSAGGGGEGGGFTVEPATRDGRGTSVILHLKEDQKEFLESWRLRNLVQRYSDFVSYPIKMPVTKDGEGEESDTPTTTLETLNKASALWRRPRQEVNAEEYSDFYKHITHDFEEPLAHTHFSLEGTQTFYSLLYVPRRAPFDLFDSSKEHGLRLYARRVLIMEECKDLLPQWLRFMKGLVDSDDLELNVSREILQRSQSTKVISRQVVKRTLDLLDELAADHAEDYVTFWEAFGAVLKEGLHFDVEQKERLAKLVRYRSSAGDSWVSLADYVSRMKEGQDEIYYAIGDSVAALAGSPHLETLLARGYEVLFMTDPVDEWAAMGLTEFEGKKLVSAMKAELDLEEPEQDEAEGDEAKGEEGAQGIDPLLARIRERLGDRVAEVRESRRLKDSPSCLVVPEGGLHPHLERLLKSQDADAPASKRIFEINGSHPLIRNLNGMVDDEGRADHLNDWIELLLDQARLTEGSPLEDVRAFSDRLTKLMVDASTGPSKSE